MRLPWRGKGSNCSRTWGHDAVAFNVDAGNMVSLRPDVAPIAHTLEMLGQMRHCHIKDVRTHNGEFFLHGYRPGATGTTGRCCRRSRSTISLAAWRFPLRMHRQADTMPLRSANPVPVEQSREVLLQSRKALETMLGQALG